ncbi:MAG: peroxidase-related enzyme [Bacteroidota bacterium]|nr:peroxidase-related enzyme [Bacteroidota bacterium]
MSWIKEIPFENALHNSMDNIIKAHSLRPHTLTGHLSLYKSVLHHSGNTLPKWYPEAIGVYVSVLNNCTYCVSHHTEGVRKNSADASDADAIIEALLAGKPESFFNGMLLEGFFYAKALTLSAAAILEDDIMRMRRLGFSDGEILEINQVCAYFNYANRVVLGLGVEPKGDILGNSPNDRKR